MNIITRGLTVAVAVGAAFGQAPSATPVIALQNLAHTVTDLGKTVPFYRDILGLPLNVAAGRPDPLLAAPAALNDDMSRFTGTKGAKFRAVSFRIPNANFGFELTEFTGVARKAVMPRIQDPGAATMVLVVRDMDTMFAKLKAAGTTIVTAGGVPINPAGGDANSKLRSVVIRDPDGFFLEILRPDPLPASAAATTMGDVLGGSVQVAIEDTGKALAFYKSAMGFVARPSGQMRSNATVAQLIGLQTPGVQWRITHGSIAGTTLDWGLIEFKGVERKQLVAGAEDPGSPAFTMVVRDIDAAVAQWKAAGGTVMTTGGVAVKGPNGAGNVFVRDVNGFLFELIQRAAQ
ncbi:MAG: VOC family protein [Acidobacteriota bacterium]